MNRLLELGKGWHLLLRVGGTVLQQIPLAFLAPSFACGLRETLQNPTLSMSLPVRQPEPDVHLPAATTHALNYSDAHRCPPGSNGVLCWSSHSSRIAVRIRT